MTSLIDDPIFSDASVEDQIREFEDFLKTLDPAPEPAPAPAPVEEPETGRLADLRRAKALIDEAIALLSPHFPEAPRG